MTANVMPANRTECKAAGMNDFIPKPLRRKELLDVLEYWYLRKREEGPARGEEKKELKNLPFDYSAFLEEMDGDEESVLVIVRGFLEELKRQLPLLKAALESRDLGGPAPGIPHH